MQPTILERAQHPISRRNIDPNVLKILYRLIAAGHAAYLVGGGVRDLMMGRRPKDFDVATSAHPAQVRELFRNSRIIGRRFRLVHVFFGPQNIEVATFRRRSEEVVDGDDPLIRQDNTFGTPEEDAFRRDFTINALFYDPGTYQVIDHAGGVSDLAARVIRTIGDPEVRIREDPVRMIRAIRFAIKLGFAIEPATRAAMELHRGDLAKASIPRLAEETYRTLMIPGADRALILMEQLDILDLLLPFLSEHLRNTELVNTSTVRNLALMGAAIEQDAGAISHPLALACLYADFYHSRMRDRPPEDRFALVEALRARGFAKADTEHMRLLLEAVTHMVTRSRMLRRLARRPYFADARLLFDLITPTTGTALAAVDEFLAPPTASATRPQPPGRRRRRRRGGRNRHRDRGANPPTGGDDTSLAEAVQPEASAAADLPENSDS